MTSARSRVTILALTLGTAACGTATMHHTKTQTDAASLPVATKEAAAIAPPPSLRMVMPRPGRSLPRLESLLGSSPMFGFFERLISGAARGFDGERPMIVVATDKKHVAYSFGIPPGSEKAQRERFQKSGLSRSAKESVDAEDRPLTCEVVSGFDGLRSVCVNAQASEEDDDAWDKLAPLVTAQPHATEADIRLDFDARVYADGAKGVSTTDDAALNAMFEALGRDVTSGNVEIMLQGTPEIRIAVGLEGKSPLTRAALSAPALPPPASFAKLPQDADLALFAHGPATDASKPARDALLVVMDGAMDGCSDAEKVQNKAEIEALVFTGGSFSFAEGYDRARVEDAARALTKKGSADARAVQVARSAMTTWSIAGFEEPSDRWKKGLGYLAAHDCSKGANKAASQKPSPAWKLPAGSIEIVTTKTRGKTKSKSFVFVAPEGERTWIAFGDDEAVVARRLKATVDGAAPLSARVSPELLKAPAAFGGFVTSSYFAWHGLDGGATPTTIGFDARRILMLASQSTGGRTPIPFAVTAATEKGGGELRARLRFDAAAISDLLALANLASAPRTK